MRLYQKLFLYFFLLIIVLMGSIMFVQYKREQNFHSRQLDRQLEKYNLLINNYINQKGYTWDKLDDFVALFPDTV
jgi:hypothetical protein